MPDPSAPGPDAPEPEAPGQRPPGSRRSDRWWAGLRSAPWWTQALAWLVAWPLLAGLLVARTRRLGPAALPLGVAVALVGGLFWVVALTVDTTGPPTMDEAAAPASTPTATGTPAPTPPPTPTTEAIPEPSPADTPAATTTPPDGQLEVHFIDVGQGDATLLMAPDVTVLVDAGDWRRSDVVPYLRAQGVEALDLVITTHPHADHIGQFDAVLEAFDVTEVWWSGATHTTRTFERAVAALEASDAAYEEPRAGDVTAVGPLGVEVVNPPADADLGDLHDSSLALRVTFGDVRFLFTGDAEAATERRMTTRHRDLLDADVYQVGHHGSSTSTTSSFLDAVSPGVAVYSARDGNSYGHPHDETVDRLVAAGVELYGTDVHGTVVVTTDGSTWSVVTARSGDATATAPDPDPSPTTSAGSDGELAVEFTSVTSPVSPGSQATAVVATAPSAHCAITVTYRSGPSSAQGLDDRTAGGDGAVSWTWNVGTRTSAGDWPIDVTCSRDGRSAAARTHITVR